MSGSDFERLRPICVALTKEANTEKLKELKKCLLSCKPANLQALQEYVLFPLRLLLKKGAQSSDDFKCELFVAMDFMLQNTTVQRIELFQDLFNCLCFSISHPTDGSKVRAVSEEYKEAVVSCLTNIFKNFSHDLFAQVYCVEFMPALGHVVALLLHMLEHERKRELRLSCLACLCACAQNHTECTHAQRDVLADILAAFLPGITLSLSRVATGDSKQGSALVAAAVTEWQNMVCLVLNDASLERCTKSSFQLAASKNPKTSALVVKRTSEWVKSTAGKLCVLTERIKQVAKHSNWRVREAMVRWSERLLSHCNQSMSGSMSHCLEVLVSLIADDYSSVASASQSALEKFQNETRDSEDSRSLVEMLEENLHSLTTELPRLIRGVDESEKLQHVRMLHGYIKLLSAHMRSVLVSSAHVQRLSHCLLQVLELDCSSIDIIQEHSVATGLIATLGSAYMNTCPRKQFVNFRDENIYKEIQSICRLLGTHGDIELLMDHFLERLHQSSLHRKQAVLVINELCAGLATSKKVDKGDAEKEQFLKNKQHFTILCKSLLDVYLAPEYLDLRTSNQQSSDDLETSVKQASSEWQLVDVQRGPSTNFRDLNSNILLICLLLEGVGIFSKVLEEGFDALLVDVLYPVLEKIGSNNAAISQTALLATQQIASSCHYSCVEELLSRNADYLVNSISLRMRHLARYPSAPLVLCVILKHSEATILPLLEDTILEILSALDAHYEDIGLAFMRILLSLVTVIRSWFPPPTQPVVKAKTKEAKRCQSALDVKKFIEDYLHQKKIASGEAMDDNGECDENMPQTEQEDVEIDEGEEDEKPEPYHVTKVSQILQRCIHLLMAADARVRLVTLDTVAEGLQVLQPYQNVLLPLVHKLWAPLLPRFTDPEMLVILKACTVLSVFAEVSRDFIRQRVCKDVFPKLAAFLKKQHTVSMKAGPVYHHSLGCKLQLTVLRDVGRLCGLLGVGEQQLHTIILACVPYLSARQPALLQQACVETMRGFAELEPDTVWLLCHELHCSDLPAPPHPGFTPVKFHGNKTKDEYTHNISAVLEFL